MIYVFEKHGIYSCGVDYFFETDFQIFVSLILTKLSTGHKFPQLLLNNLAANCQNTLFSLNFASIKFREKSRAIFRENKISRF